MEDELDKQTRDDDYRMGYDDGQGDLPQRVRAFLEALINDESFRNLPQDLRDEAKRLADLDPPF